MRIKEIMERVDNPAYDPEAGFLRNVGRAGLDQFVRSQLSGTSAYSDEEEEERRSKRAAQQAARQAAHAIDQSEVPSGTVVSQTDAAKTQTAAPNFSQGNINRTTINAPTAAVPAIRPYVPQAMVPNIATPPVPAVNPAAEPEVYYLDNKPLNPNNPIHSRLIAQMQQQGITQAKTGTAKK
jgi:hypothetical protein